MWVIMMWMVIYFGLCSGDMVGDFMFFVIFMVLLRRVIGRL